jgi:steroid 5-alpha-reductase/3-oxo-5-alpha-steroid 4-dehydrogenase 1
VSERLFHHHLALAYLALAAVVFVALFFVSAAYGRHTRRGWGPEMNTRLAWVLMESPSLLIMTGCLLTARHPTLAARILGWLWVAHYAHRALIFPFRMKMAGRRTPVLIPVLGALFNCGNAYLNGRWLFAFSPGDETIGIRYIAGVALFVVGFAINYRADRTLAALRGSTGSGYRIPHGGLYRWISCPNYFGEILEWSGFALAAWSIPALSFAVWTAANLVPRARSHHRWYEAQFADYPPERKALFPGLW